MNSKSFETTVSTKLIEKFFELNGAVLDN